MEKPAPYNQWEKVLMFSHVCVGSDDIQKPEVFYDAVFGAIRDGNKLCAMHPLGQ